MNENDQYIKDLNTRILELLEEKRVLNEELDKYKLVVHAIETLLGRKIMED